MKRTVSAFVLVFCAALSALGIGSAIRLGFGLFVAVLGLTTF